MSNHQLLFFPIASLAATLALTPPLGAQSSVFVFSALNTASYDGTGIAQGSMFVIFGYGMGPDSLTGATTLPLPNGLAGTSVMVTAGTTNLSCPLFYTSSGQVAAVLPSNTPTGVAYVGVTYNGNSSGTSVATINVIERSIGVFTISDFGYGPGIFTDGFDASLKTASNSAKPGDTLIAWATGAGPIDGPDNVVPSTFPYFPDIQVWVGNLAAHTIYAGRSGCCVAVDQISFIVPEGITGCNVPVVITAAGKSSATVTLPVSAAGGSCLDSGPTIPTDLLSRSAAEMSVRAGLIGIGPTGLIGVRAAGPANFARRMSAALHVEVPEEDAAKIMRAVESRNRRAINAALAKYGPQWKALSSRQKRALASGVNLGGEGVGAVFGEIADEGLGAALLSAQLPPTGSCVVLPSAVPGGTGTKGRGLDAGSSISLIGAAGSLNLARAAEGVYGARLSSSIIGPNIPLGAYTLSGPGGADVGPFSVTVNVSTRLSLSNKSSLGPVDRTQPLTVTWTGGTTGHYVLLGGYTGSAFANLPPRIPASTTRFLCAEDGGKGTFTIPAMVLSALWPTPDGSGVLFIAPNPASQPISISGLDVAWFMDGSSDSTNVVFK